MRRKRTLFVPYNMVGWGGGGGGWGEGWVIGREKFLSFFKFVSKS